MIYRSWHSSFSVFNKDKIRLLFWGVWAEQLIVVIHNDERSGKNGFYFKIVWLVGTRKGGDELDLLA